MKRLVVIVVYVLLDGQENHVLMSLITVNQTHALIVGTVLV